MIFESQEDRDVVWRAILALYQSPNEGDRAIGGDLERIMRRENFWRAPESDAEMAVLEWKAQALGMKL